MKKPGTPIGGKFRGKGGEFRRSPLVLDAHRVIFGESIQYLQTSDPHAQGTAATSDTPLNGHPPRSMATTSPSPASAFLIRKYGVVQDPQQRTRTPASPTLPDWACSRCTLSNRGGTLACAVCGMRAPPPQPRTAAPRDPPALVVGQRVRVDAKRVGFVAFVGRVHFARGTWAGLVLDAPCGDCDGCVDGHRYFNASKDFGLFVLAEGNDRDAASIYTDTSPGQPRAREHIVVVDDQVTPPARASMEPGAKDEDRITALRATKTTPPPIVARTDSQAGRRSPEFFVMQSRPRMLSTASDDATAPRFFDANPPPTAQPVSRAQHSAMISAAAEAADSPWKRRHQTPVVVDDFHFEDEESHNVIVVDDMELQDHADARRPKMGRKASRTEQFWAKILNRDEAVASPIGRNASPGASVGEFSASDVHGSPDSLTTSTVGEEMNADDLHSVGARSPRRRPALQRVPTAPPANVRTSAADAAGVPDVSAFKSPVTHPERLSERRNSVRVESPESNEAPHSAPRRSAAEKTPTPEWRLFQRVRTDDGRSGYVAFVGTVDFASGLWVGVVLETASGKNDGSIGGRRYFKCSARHGIFVRPDRIVDETRRDHASVAEQFAQSVGGQGAAASTVTPPRTDEAFDEVKKVQTPRRVRYPRMATPKSPRVEPKPASPHVMPPPRQPATPSPVKPARKPATPSPVPAASPPSRRAHHDEDPDAIDGDDDPDAIDGDEPASPGHQHVPSVLGNSSTAEFLKWRRPPADVHVSDKVSFMRRQVEALFDLPPGKRAAAKRKLCLLWHPDKNAAERADCTEVLKTLLQAIDAGPSAPLLRDEVREFRFPPVPPGTRTPAPLAVVSMTNGDTEAANRWLEQAKHDMEVLTTLYRSRHYADVCFYAQQVVEKCLKALVCATEPFPAEYRGSHDVRALLMLCCVPVRIQVCKYGDCVGVVADVFARSRYPYLWADGQSPSDVYSFADSRLCRDAALHASHVTQFFIRE